MFRHDKVLDNHSHEPVPAREQVSGVRIAVIIVGIAITLPAFLLGAEVVSSLGFSAGLLACVTAGAILTLTASLAMLVGTRTHLSTAAIIRLTFGDTGSKIVNALLSSTLFGWYGITAVLFGQVASRTLADVAQAGVPVMLLVIAGSVLMVLTTIFGFRAIDRLSRVAVPLLALMLLAAVILVFREMSWTEIVQLPPLSGSGAVYSIGHGASLIIGGFMVGVTITPDMSRFARRGTDAVQGAMLSYGSMSQLVLFLTGVPALVIGQKDLIITMTMLGLGLPALAVMLLATWTTNVNNLYSASLSLAQVLPRRWPDWLITVCAGVTGTALAIIIGREHFVGFLTFLSIAIPPIAGIYITDFFLLRRLTASPSTPDRVPAWNGAAFTAWLLAGCFGVYEVFNKYSVTGVQALDTVIIAAIIYYLFSRRSNFRPL